MIKGLDVIEVFPPNSGALHIGTYGKDKFVLVSSGVMSYSTDGVNWTEGEKVSATPRAYGAGKFVALSDDKGYYSTDGIKWTQGPALPFSATWGGATYGGDKFVAVPNFISFQQTYTNKAMYSTDGVTWQQMTFPIEGSWTPIVYGDGKFITAAYQTNKALYSSDGIHWTETTLPFSGAWHGAAYGNGVYVLLSLYDTNGTLGTRKGCYSTDGIYWEEMTLPSKTPWNQCAFGDGVFIAVGSDSGMYGLAYSVDGINWTSASSQIEEGKAQYICYGNNKFLTNGRKGTTLITTINYDDSDDDDDDDGGDDSGGGSSDNWWDISGLRLVTDRTQAHVDRLEELSAIGWDNMTESEKAEWWYGGDDLVYWADGEQLRGRDGIWYLLNIGGTNKGAYNIEDYNRVGTAVDYLAKRFKKMGYTLTVYVKNDWTEKDIPTPTHQQTYLDNIRTLRAIMPLYATTPQVPSSMDNLTPSKANDIEQILLDIDSVTMKSQAVYHYTGMSITGMAGVFI